jgi:hypothetical protein
MAQLATKLYCPDPTASRIGCPSVEGNTLMPWSPITSTPLSVTSLAVSKFTVAVTPTGTPRSSIRDSAVRVHATVRFPNGVSIHPLANSSAPVATGTISTVWKATEVDWMPRTDLKNQSSNVPRKNYTSISTRKRASDSTYMIVRTRCHEPVLPLPNTC